MTGPALVCFCAATGPGFAVEKSPVFLINTKLREIYTIAQQ